MPLRNIIGTVILIGLVMAGLNRFRATRRLIGSDASP